jgi:hypothetical protein
MIKNNVNENGRDEKNDLKYEYDLQYMLSTREGMVARDLAEGLNDRKSLRFFFSLALEHSERFLREVYRKAMETPEDRIKKSRGALFAYLVKKYEHLDDYDD